MLDESRRRCPFARRIERLTHPVQPFTNISLRRLRALTYALTVAVAAARRSCLIQPQSYWGSSHEWNEGAPQAPRDRRGRRIRDCRAHGNGGRGPGHQGGRDGLQHPSRRRGGRPAGSGDHPRGDRQDRRAQRDGASQLHLREQQRRQRDAGQHHRVDDLRQPDGIAAGPGRPVDPGPGERPSPRNLRRRRFRRGRREPVGDPVLCGGTGRGAEGRRLGGVRLRRDRRRDQLHHAPGLQGRGGECVLRHAHPRRWRRPVRSSPERSASAIWPRTATTPSSRLSTTSRRRSSSARATSRRPTTCPPSASTRRPGQSFPGFISTGGIGNPGFPDCQGQLSVGGRCRFDPGALPRNAGPSRDQAAEPLRRRTVPDQSRLAGLFHRSVLAPEDRRLDPAGSDLGPDLHHRHGDGRRRHPAAADQPVLSAQSRRRGGRGRPAAQRALSLRRVRQPHMDGHQRGLAGSRGRQGNALGLGFRRVDQLQREHRQ